MITSVFAYIGPETVLPAMSILAAIGGFLLTCFSFVTAPFKRVLAAIAGKAANEEEKTSAPPS